MTSSHPYSHSRRRPPGGRLSRRPLRTIRRAPYPPSRPRRRRRRHDGTTDVRGVYVLSRKRRLRPLIRRRPRPRVVPREHSPPPTTAPASSRARRRRIRQRRSVTARMSTSKSTPRPRMRRTHIDDYAEAGRAVASPWCRSFIPLATDVRRPRRTCIGCARATRGNDDDDDRRRTRR